MASENFEDNSKSEESPSASLPASGSGNGISPRRGGKGGPATLESPKSAGESSKEPDGAAPMMPSPTSAGTYATPELPERINADDEQPSIFAGEGVQFDRWFTRAGEDVFATTEWDYRTSIISGERGEVVFEQKDVEIPKAWSMLATNVVVSKYFRGKVGTPGRENSVKQLVSRVADTIYNWGKKGGYFASQEDADVFHAELKYLLLHQYMAFNSPVWFNLGVADERPQVSACFINSVEDTMESILTLARTEGMLFKWGSGTGTNLSVLRSSHEGLKGGGTASGPVSFMRGFDAFAGAIKSGGKTRRAAKMVILNSDHPDIEEFIECKADAEKKAHALIEAGYSGAFNVNNGAYDSVYFQNANHSVRATDDFMRAVELDREWSTIEVLTGNVAKTYRARDLMRKMAEAAWVCGDPGMQFDTTANRWHTCAGTARINASNPCVTGDTQVATTDGWQRIDALVGKSARIYGADGQPHFVDRIFPTGVQSVYRLRTRAGFELRLTADHKVLTVNRGDVPASDLRPDDRVFLQGAGFGRRTMSERLAFAIGISVGDGCLARTSMEKTPQEIITLVMSEKESEILESIAGEVNRLKTALKAPGSIGRNDGASVRYGAQPGSTRLAFSSQPVVDLFKEFAVLNEGSDQKRFTPAVYELDQPALASVLRGLFTADGTVANYGAKSQYVALDSTSLELLQQTQLLLLSFGIKAKIYRERRNGVFTTSLPDGQGGNRMYPVKEVHSLRISRSSRFLFERAVGFDPLSAKADALALLNQEVAAYRDTLTDEIESLELLGEEPVYDLTEPVTSHFSANGLIVHNCSEFFFLDDTACNLASLNLMKFRTPSREFDIEMLRHAVRVTITAMEIMVGNASYPTDKIAINSHDFRPLGLGYANLGALLMARGLAYDSDEGRAYAGAITAILSGEGYTQSAKIARRVGPFNGYEKNKQPMTRVMQMHRDHVEGIPSRHLVPDDMIQAARKVWDNCLDEGAKWGYRNAQISVLAPTGTIGFMMDCDTTGVEPDIAIVKFKSLVGGGFFKIVNQTVPEALERLGYSASERKAILDYIETQDTIEGAPGLSPEHLPVFDCAFRAKNGTRTIHYMGHIKMMSAVQPFISGAISKTVNMPHDATPDDIAEAYLQAWKWGVKALAIYRDGSKKTQPLSTGQSDDKAATKKEAAATVEVKPFRRKLQDERASLTHKFSVGGHEGYLTVGLYPEGVPGEIFVTMSKEGSVVSGLMDSFATAISLALQYGVPLKTLVDKFMHTRFEPSGFTGNPDIPMAKSIMDYLFRYLALKFLDKDERQNVGLIADQKDDYDNGEAEDNVSPSITAALASVPIKSTPGPQGPVGAPATSTGGRAAAAERQVFVTQSDAPPCPECGGITTRNGACYRCANCGTSIGCS